MAGLNWVNKPHVVDLLWSFVYRYGNGYEDVSMRYIYELMCMLISGDLNVMRIG